MDKQRQRARDLVPNILLTVLSMIQALALEFFWTRVVASEFLWQGGWEAIIGWLQVSCVLLGILLLWLFYVSIVLRFSWLPTISDTLFPFFLGLLEFGLIQAMHPDSIAVWLLLLASILGVAVLSGQMTLRRARMDPVNAYFFSQMPPANWRSFRESFIAIGSIGFCGLLLLMFDSNLLSLVGVLLSLAAFAYQLQQAQQYWLHSMRSDNTGHSPSHSPSHSERQDTSNVSEDERNQ